MNARQRLPNRRAHDSFALNINGEHFRIGIGREANLETGQTLGGVREIFICGQRPNSAIDSIAGDGAILISLLLQHGCSVETIAHAMKRNPNGTPATLFGVVADLLKGEG